MRPARVAPVLLALLLAGGDLLSDGAPRGFRFVDVAGQLGLHDALRGMMGHSAAWGDVDGDGRFDLFVGTFADRPAENYTEGGAAGPVPNRLLFNRESGFEPASLPEIAWRGRASGSVFADLDGDGRPELHVSNNGGLGKENRLYDNTGRGRLVDVTERPGSPVALPETSRSVGALDFDGDGRIDLLVLGTVGKDRTILFRNLGNLEFEISDAIPGDATGLGLATGDIDGDTLPDVFIGGPNRLFINTGSGTFREASVPALANDFHREDDAPSCGAAFGDVDRDGDLDLLVGSHHKAPWRAPSPIRLYLNESPGSGAVHLREVTAEVGIEPCPMKVPHVEIRDFDNDGWPDLYTAVVTLRDGEVHPAIYRNLGLSSGRALRFRETAFVHRPDFPGPEDFQPDMRGKEFYERLVRNRKVQYFAPGPSADFDNDGRLDLFLPSWWPTFPSLLLRNETPSGHHLDVAVRGRDGVNPHGLGSVVRAYRKGRAGRPDDLIASEQIATGYGFCSGQPPIAHLGLGEETSCDLVVTLPHNAGTIVLREVPADCRREIEAGGE